MSEIEGNTLDVSSDNTVDVNLGSWKDSLPEDLREEACLQDFKGVDSLAKSYAHLVKMQGNSIRIPGPDAPQEDKDAFYAKLQQVEGVARIDDLDSVYTRLGRPENIDGYEIPEFEGIQFNKDAVAELKNLAFEKGLNNDQLSSVLAIYAKEKQEEVTAHNRVVEQSEATLKKIWGEDYNARVAGAKAALEMYKDSHGEAIQQLLESPAGSNPVIINILADLYASMKEKGAIRGDSAPSFGVSPQEAAAQISEMNRNPEIMKILRNPTHPENSKYRAKREQLYKLAAPYLKEKRG